MIADLDQTIEKLITAELPIKNGEIDIAFDQPKREWSARLSRPTLNFFLFDIRENNVLRQHQWEKMAQMQGNGGPPHIQQKRTPFRIDCHYIITSWAANPKDEHRLLSRCLLTLFRYPLLPDTFKVGDMKEQPFKVQTKLVTHDHLTNPAELWGAMDNEIRPSMSYLVTLAADPWTEVTGPAVTSYTMTTGIVENLPGPRINVETAVTTHHIAGTITTKDTPQANITVAIKNSGFVSTTNNDGQYILGSLPEGKHTLVAWPAEGKPVEKTITIPGTGYDIEL
ncbi:MAG: DUF4255 domain-containing protein [Anaerolineae bacterium]|nr:DUF4255 domain-containing protein [Anaerolineae bacterium]